MAGLVPAILTRTHLAKDAIPISKHPIELDWSSPAMTGLAARAVRQQQVRLVLLSNALKAATKPVGVFCAIPDGPQARVSVPCWPTLASSWNQTSNGRSRALFAASASRSSVARLHYVAWGIGLGQL
jgi:hypothetical protein